MKVFLLCIFSVVSFMGYSQENKGIQFHDSSWNNLLSKAKAEDKLIFMDAYTTWCGPCKMMSKNVFPDSRVGDLYNRNFINAYTDMEKGEGIDLRKKYEVKAYPTYLFINGDGDVVHKIVGECSITEFIQHGLDALSPVRSLSYFQKNYNAQKNNYEFIAGYLQALKDTYEEDKTGQVATDFLALQKQSTLKEKANWGLINKYLNNVPSSTFQYVVDHQGEFADLYGKEEVDQKIYQTYLMWPRHYLHFSPNEKVTFDNKGFDSFLAQVENSKYAKKQEVIARAKLTVYSGLREWKNYINTVDQMITAKIIPLNPKGAEDIYFSIDQVYRFDKEDQNNLKSATRLAQVISEKIEGISVQNKATYLDMYANLLDETGKKSEAIVVRKSIDEKKLAEAQKSNPFQQMKIIPKQN